MSHITPQLLSYLCLLCCQDAENYSIPLNLTDNAYSSRTFKEASSQIMTILATETVTMNNHEKGIWTEHFLATNELTSFYNVLSNNNDRQGNEFVSTLEAFDYPIYGNQWHPEKNPFEWQKNADGTPYEDINHSYHAILTSSSMGQFFVNETRKNFHAFKTPADEDAALITNYKTTKTTGSFVETYFFSNSFGL